jgi:hypothetical protein
MRAKDQVRTWLGSRSIQSGTRTTKAIILGQNLGPFAARCSIRVRIPFTIESREIISM